MSGQVARWIGAKLERRIACWSVCLSLTLTLAVGGLALAVISSLLLDDVREPLERDARVVEVQLEQALKSFLGDIAELAISPLVVTALTDSHGRDSYFVPFLAGHKTGEARQALLVLTDAEGRTIAANRKDGLRSYLAPWLDEVIRHNLSVVRIVSPVDGAGGVLLAAYPVVGPSGRPEGAMIGEMTLDVALKQAVAALSPGTSAGLFGDFGEVLAVTAPLGRSSDPMNVDRPLRLAEISPGQGLMLRVGIDRHAALEPVYRLLPVFAAVGVAVALAVFGLAALMGRRLSKPIRDLAEAAGRVTGEAPFDDIPIRAIAGIRRGDEVGHLARAFAGMLHRLHHLYSELEAEVERRTEALGHTQAELARVLASVEDVICSFTPDLSRILYINPAIQRATGMTPEDFLAQPDLLRAIIDPLDRGGWDAALAGLGAETPTTQAVFRVIGPGGARRWLRGRYQLVARGEDGQPVIDSIVTDITERRVAELAMAGSEARLRAIFETVGDSIITIDGFGFIEGVNLAACRLFGYEADEMIGRNVSMLMPEPLRAAHDGYIRRYLETGAGRVVGFGREVTGLRRNGEEFPAELAVGVLNAGDGASFVGVIRDITERKRTQDALRTAKEEAEAAGNAKTEFLAVMSHEIRTPLNGVLGMIGLLEDGEQPAEQRRYIDAARRSSEALLTILNDILDFSKMEAGRLDLVFGPLDIARLVADVIEDLGAQAREKAISLAAEIEPGVPPLIRGDEGRVRQVLLNLVSNAIKFTHSGGVRVRVEAGAGAGAGRLRVSVIDSGIGIPGDAQGRLFSRFSQVDSSTSRRYGGTGLGLAIARKLVTMMEGEIGVDSTPGAGSSFWFTLPGEPLPLSESPASQAAEEARREASRPRMPARRRAGGRILLVEDSETNRLVAPPSWNGPATGSRPPRTARWRWRRWPAAASIWC